MNRLTQSIALSGLLLASCTPNHLAKKQLGHFLQEHREKVANIIPEEPHQDRVSVFTKNAAAPLPDLFGLDNEAKHISVASNIVAHQPDFALIQEVVNKSEAHLYDIPGYYKTHFPSDHFYNKGGLITLSKQRPQKSTFVRFENQGKFFSKQFSDRLIEKGFIVSLFDEGKTAVINTHLLSTYDEDASLDAGNMAQANQLVTYIKALKARGTEVIVGGDFNFEPDDIQHHIMLHAGLTEHTDQIDETFPRTGEDLDHIYSTFNVGESDIITGDKSPEFNLSDHMGIIARISRIRTVCTLNADVLC